MNFKRLTKQYRHHLCTALKEAVAIPSVYDEKTVTKEHPYGKEVDNALKYVGHLGEQYGFDIDYCDGHGVELSIGDHGPLIGIFAHLDVVPVVDGWKYGPFNLVNEKGNFYGRGCADDKGPGLAALYAVKALKDNGLLHDVRVKIFFGGDEERGSSCLHYYFHDLKKEAPTYGFTPDSGFPLIYGEKGGVFVKCSKKFSSKHILSISGGIALNIVMDRCEFKIAKDDEISAKLKNYAGKFEVNSDNTLVTFLGKSAHGSIPQCGENAFLLGCKALGEIYQEKDLENLYQNLLDSSGKAFNGYCYGEHLKETTYSIGKVELKNGELAFSVDFRHPEGCDTKKCVNNLANAIGFKAEVLGSHELLLKDPNSPLVQALLSAYRKEAHKPHAKAETTGGGTYAKEAPNTIAFGAEFPGHDYKMHETDETIPEKDLYLAMTIYARAIYNLTKIKE